MEISKNINGETLLVTLSGRLDTTTAPELEGAIKDDLANVKTVKFDMGAIEYVSSAGLRVILSVQKAMTAKGGELTLKKVNDEVMEVFDMTGFSSFLKFED